MDPQTQFCHNPDCAARGRLGLGNIRVHGRKERRYRCTACGRTFAATRDTPFYRLKKSADLVTLVITLLGHGCPVQAPVAAFGLDERTVAEWRDRAGRHARRFHDHRVLQWQVESRPTSCTSRRSPGGSGWPGRSPSPRGSGWAEWSASVATS